MVNYALTLTAALLKRAGVWLILAPIAALMIWASPVLTRLFIWLLCAALTIGVMLAFGLILTTIDEWSVRGPPWRR
jgi:hypothetical protein